MFGYKYVIFFFFLQFCYIMFVYYSFAFPETLLQSVNIIHFYINTVIQRWYVVCFQT